jgi:hypothetical protein
LFVVGLPQIFLIKEVKKAQSCEIEVLGIGKRTDSSKMFCDTTKSPSPLSKGGELIRLRRIDAEFDKRDYFWMKI